MKSIKNRMSETIKMFGVFALSILVLHSCKKKDEDTPTPTPSALTVYTVSDLVADTGSQGVYTFYSLRENRIIANADSATDKWDLGFKGSTIITNSGISGPGNGGCVIMDGIFEEITSAPTSGYATDEASGLAIPTGSDNGWYHYTGSGTPPEHALLPIAGKVFMVRTADGKYAKVDIISYYKGNPNTTTSEFANSATRPDARHYTFRFVFQPDGSTNLN